jgi:hypothetical protein
MSSGPAPHPWRRYLRFSVRGLIVLVLVVGAGLGRIVRQAHIQRDAVAAILKTGGTIFYDWEQRDGKVIPGGKLWAPTWLVDLIGVDYFGHPTVAEIRWRWMGTDAALAQVGRLTQLQVLNVSSPSLSDAGLARLKGLTKLSILDLAGTQVTDAGVNELQRALPGLTIYR